MSIVFDRAAEFYDQTRAMPPEHTRRVIDSLIREARLEAGQPILELGVGTGRIAIPLAVRVGRVSGVDLSVPMMQKLRGKLPGSQGQVDIARADVTRLPFPDSSFDLVYAVHVLHLVDGWRQAIAEARRTLKPGGRFAVSGIRRAPDSPAAQMRAELHRLAGAGELDFRRPGVQTEEEIEAELEHWGHKPRVVHVDDWTDTFTAGQFIDEFDRQVHSETWMIPREVLDRVIPQLRMWAEQQFGSLDRELPHPSEFHWLIATK